MYIRIAVYHDLAQYSYAGHKDSVHNYYVYIFLSFSSQNHTVSIQCVKPFELAYKLLSTSFQTIDSLIYEQPFVLVTEVQCTSPWQLNIVSSQLDQVCAIYMYVRMYA